MSGHRIATEEEIKQRTNLRSLQFVFCGKYQELNATWRTPCLSATPLTKHIWHKDSIYVCDMDSDEKYRCKDCGAAWYLPIPDPKDGP